MNIYLHIYIHVLHVSLSLSIYIYYIYYIYIIYIYIEMCLSVSVWYYPWRQHFERFQNYLPPFVGPVPPEASIFLAANISQGPMIKWGIPPTVAVFCWENMGKWWEKLWWKPWGSFFLAYFQTKPYVWLGGFVASVKRNNIFWVFYSTSSKKTSIDLPYFPQSCPTIFT